MLILQASIYKCCNKTGLKLLWIFFSRFQAEQTEVELLCLQTWVHLLLVVKMALKYANGKKVEENFAGNIQDRYKYNGEKILKCIENLNKKLSDL